MKPNVGKTDRLLRIIMGLVLLSLLFVLDGPARLIGLLGIVPLATAGLSYCPLYPLLGINTCCGSCGGSCGGKEKDEPVEKDEE